MPKHMHEGHRQRMRDRIEKSGILSLQPHEVLEYLLYSFVPRKDTNEIAHNLLKEFGSISGVLHAEPRFLKNIPGMTENAVLFLTSLPDIYHRYLTEITTQNTSVVHSDDVKRYLCSLLYNRPAETVCIAALDIHEKMIASDIISVGGRTEVRLDVKTVVDYAQKNRAHGIILAHNHPDGNINPSISDYNLTYEIYSTLSAMGFRLLDHYIFSANDYFSFKDHDYMKNFADLYGRLKEGAWIQQ